MTRPENYTAEYRFPEDVEFELECMEEDIPFKGNCSAIDDETDAEQEQWIRDQLDRGNEWAWCYVRVVAKLSTFCGFAGLGGCSYRSRKDFESDAYEDLKQEALEDLKRDILTARERITRIVGV